MEEKIREILSRDDRTIPEDKNENLYEAGVIDSFEIVTIVMDIEDEFKIEIDPALVVVENFSTIKSIMELINRIKND